MDTEGLGKNRFAPKPLAFKLRGGGNRSTFPLSLKLPRKRLPSGMSNRAVLDVYNSLHQAIHPKPTHQSSPKGKETRRAWWALGRGRGKTPPRTITAAPGTPPPIYTPSRTPTGRPAAWARWLWEPSETGPSARRPRPSPSRRLTLARALCRPPAATAGLARVAVRAGGLALGAQLWDPHERRLQGPSPPGDSTQESRGGCGASQGPTAPRASPRPRRLAPVRERGASPYRQPAPPPDGQEGRQEEPTHRHPPAPPAPGYRQGPRLRHPPRSPSFLLLPPPPPP